MECEVWSVEMCRDMYLVVGFWLRNLKMKCNLFISMYTVCILSMYVQHVC